MSDEPISTTLFNILRSAAAALGGGQARMMYTTDGIVDHANTLRDDAPVGLVCTAHDAWAQEKDMTITPDSVYHSFLTAVYKTLDTHRTRLPRIIEPRTRRIRVDDNRNVATPPSNDLLARAHKACINNDQLYKRMTDYAFDTTDTATRRTVHATFLGHLQPPVFDAALVAPSTGATTPRRIRHIHVAGTGADWMIVKQYANDVIAIIRNHYPNLDIGDERFRHVTKNPHRTYCDEKLHLFNAAVDRLVAGNFDDETLKNAYQSDGQCAHGWIIDLTFTEHGKPIHNYYHDPCVIPYYNTATNTKLFLVCAQQNARQFAEAVVEVTAEPWISVWNRMNGTHEDVADEKGVGVRMQHARDALIAAIDQESVEKALDAITDLGAEEHEMLVNMVVGENWTFARTLATRIIVPEERTQHATTGAADVDDDDDDDVYEPTVPVETKHDNARREFTIEQLPHAAFLRLQRWALDEMINDPTLDLTGLTTFNTHRHATFRVYVEVKSTSR